MNIDSPLIDFGFFVQLQLIIVFIVNSKRKRKMKKLLFSTIPVLSSVFVGLTSLSVEAKQMCGGMTPRSYVEPSILANMAFRGAFQDQGIPGSTKLETELKAGGVSGADIVAAAVEACYLNDEYGMKTNRNFTRNVEMELEAIYKGN